MALATSYKQETLEADTAWSWGSTPGQFKQYGPYSLSWWSNCCNCICQGQFCSPPLPPGHPQDSDRGQSDHTGDYTNSNSFQHHPDNDIFLIL